MILDPPLLAEFGNPKSSASVESHPFDSAQGRL
jgi:hypothetical protein